MMVRMSPSVSASLAAIIARCRSGMTTAARIPTSATTITSSVKVKPLGFLISPLSISPFLHIRGRQAARSGNVRAVLGQRARSRSQGYRRPIGREADAAVGLPGEPAHARDSDGDGCRVVTVLQHG